jgi:ABC-type branched-subunit amino acid transport system ATPase component/branched-subunit amino acid ABC-type transport system permease component
MQQFLALVVSGAISGTLFSLVGSGLTLSYSATGIFNFSYGGVAFSSAYLFYEFNSGLHWPPWVALIVVVGIFGPLLGIVIDSVVFRHLVRASDSAKIVATVGLLLAIPALTEWIFDGLIDVGHFALPTSSTVLQVGFPAGIGPVPQITWHLPGGILLTSNQLVVLCSAVVCAGALYVLLRRTSLGLRMRAAVDRPDLALMRGVNSGHTSRMAWIIGTMLAALAGVVGAPILGSISTNSYTVLVFVASAAAVIGRLRSIPLVFLGGIFIGIAENLVTGYVPLASEINGLNASVPVVILLAALVILARQRGRRAGQSAEEVPPPDYLQHLPLWRRALPWTLATVFLIVYVTLLASSFWAGVIAQGLALSLVFMSFVVVTGMGGMVSLAQATFVTTAGITTGLLFNHFGLPLYLAAMLAIAITALMGIVVALPALRLGGLYLALATLALAILGDTVLFQWNWLTNSSSGWALPRFVIGPLNFSSDRTMALVLLAMVLLVMLAIRNLRISSWGRSIAAVRSSEVGAATSGVSAIRVKLGLFAVSAAIAGLGGIMYASFQTSVSNTTAPYEDGLLWLATVVVFGIRRPAAAALAGIVSVASPVIIQSGFHWWSWVPGWLSWNGTQVSEVPVILFGLGAVSLAQNPDGFLSQAAKQRYEWFRGRALRRSLRDGEATAPVTNGHVTVPPTLTPGQQAVLDEASEISAELQEHQARLVEASVVHSANGAQVPCDTTKPILTVSNLHAGYGELEVLHGLSLDLFPQRITAVLGPNGGGKSTLCGALAGLVQPTSGQILFESLDITEIAAHRRVGLGLIVAPESRGIFPGLSVEENLELRLTPDSRNVAYERFPILGRRRAQLAGTLSGGEQQMLALAPVIVDPPKVVIIDEPTLGLAPLVTAQLMDLLQELRDAGAAVLLIEEKVRDALQVADQIILFELGHIVWAGSRAEIDDERLIRNYLGGRS